MYLIFDTETTGLPRSYKAPLTDFNNWPRLVQLAWQLHANNGSLINNENFIIKPEEFTIPFNAQKIHGISTQRALDEGIDLKIVLEKFASDVKKAKAVVGHNVEFDNNIVGCEYLRASLHNILADIKLIDTKLEATEFVALPGGRGSKFKWPTLTELHIKLFKVAFEDAHDAAFDVDATAKCFFGLLNAKVIQPLDDTSTENINYEAPKLSDANFSKDKNDKKSTDQAVDIASIISPYCHIHVHTQYSILQATPNIKNLIAKAKEYNMSAIGMTDLGNMYGAYKFVDEALANDIKPIVGCEFYISEERKMKKFTKDSPDKMLQQVLLAKNKHGYHNLAKLSSLGFIEGLYGLYPRIDKALIKQYKDNLIALSGGLKSEIPYLILNIGDQQAEKAFCWWHKLFGDDFYVELNRHGLEEENHLNEVLISFARKYNVKIIASNEVFYINKSDSKAHDVLLCVKENKSINDPVGQGRLYRTSLPNSEYYLKSQDEMKALFSDFPEGIENIQELIGKVESYKLKRNVLLPKFNFPKKFEDSKDVEDGGNRGENNFLRHITYQGAKKKYGEITSEINERLDFELKTIENTGYPGYFLIVQDFTTEARNMGVSVGIGRGSVAGSVVAYCIGITNVDPIKYNLLFERFLNPDRVSLPDIDIDFDNEGRGKVIKYVVAKYGYNQVAQIITYGSMAAKSSIRDAARVMELSLSEANAIAKLVPNKIGITLSDAFKEVKKLKEISKGIDLKANVINQAIVIEGSIRNLGIHASGIIITPDDITNHVPVTVAKDAELLVTQFDNSVVEDAGMLKIDFLGLKTLSIIKTTIANIKESKGIEINIDEISLDDKVTYELYQRGETNGTFQFESSGMQKYLRKLKPDRLADLIAMNALFRPGPMEYIPEFIDRKQGKKEIIYLLAGMEEYLAETYGITVYQEQVMLLSQKLADFTKGEADMLRKGIGKKEKKIIDQLKPKFMEGCVANGHDEKIVEQIWKDWEAFAFYAFNKSHATCYSVIAYHTGYLKANYMPEFMAAVLTHNQDKIEKVTFFIEECRNRGIQVLGPHVNESNINFRVNKKGEIRFGLGAIKGIGDAAVAAIIEVRDANGYFKDIYDFATRVNSYSVSKKNFEVLAMSGVFDCFETYHRRQYLITDNGQASLIENAIKYADKVKFEKESTQVSLFGGNLGMTMITPKVQDVKPFGQLEKLKIEKEVIGLYISGHPLDQFQFEINKYCNTKLSEINDDLKKLQSKGVVKFAGIVTDVVHRISKNNNPYGIITLEDFNDSKKFFLFSDTYIKMKNFFEVGWFLYMEGTVQNRWQTEELEFKIKIIELLAELRNKKTKCINLSIKLEDVNETIIQEILNLADAHKGKSQLKINIYDAEINQNINLLSRKIKISPDNKLLKKIDEMDNVKYSFTV